MSHTTVRVNQSRVTSTAHCRSTGKSRFLRVTLEVTMTCSATYVIHCSTRSKFRLLVLQCDASFEKEENIFRNDCYCFRRIANLLQKSQQNKGTRSAQCKGSYGGLEL